MPKAHRTVFVGGNNRPIMKMFYERGGFHVMADHQNFSKNKPDLVVFPGGADINPELYKEPKLSRTNFNRHTDEYDLDVYEEFKNTPKIGICRGAQFLNVMAGGALWQHVNNHTSNHEMTDVLLYKKPIWVTSTHHQMMIPDEKSGEVLAFAMVATDYQSGIKRERPAFDPEVVWYNHTQALCYQPHPEYDLRDTEDHRNYFFDLIDYFF